MSLAAATNVVECDVLCYLRNKFDKMPVKLLKSSLADFYTVEVLCDAKKQLLDDISVLNLSVKMPHVPQRRDGDTRLTREIDEMFALLSRLDEHKHLDDLPRYVASGPDSMPSGRIYEGDLSVLLNMMKKMSSEISELRSKLISVARDVRAIQSCPPEPFPSLPHSIVINKANDQQRLQPQSTVVSAQSIAKPVAGNPDGVFENTVSKSKSTYDDNRSAVSGSSWANLAPTPCTSSNRFDVLASATDDDEDTAFQPAPSRRGKRPRNRTSSPVVQPPQAQRPRADRNNAQQRRSELLVFGKSTSRRGIYAAKALIRKAVFYVGNVNKECTEHDIVSFVKGMNVNVVSCFEVRPRRRYVDDRCDDRKAFRLCISDDSSERMLDASWWPQSVIVSNWHFKQRSTEAGADDKRRRVEDEGASAAEEQSAGHDQSTDYVSTVDRDSGSAQNNTLSDDTILAVNDHVSAVDMDDETSAPCNNG